MLLRGGDLHLAMRYGPASYVLVAVVTIAAFSLSDLYRAVIRFIDQRLLSVTGLALAIAVLCAYLILFAINDERFPRSALAIYWFVVFSYVVTSRIGIRNFLRNHHARRRPQSEAVAIYGAGEAGARLALTMRSSDEYRAMCFFDDKHVLNERNIAGLRVFHTDRQAEIVSALGIHAIVIAIPAVSPVRLRAIMHRLAQPGVTIKILSRLVDLADDKVTPRDSIRELKFEDLLGRPPVPPQMELFARCVRNKNVLVTGAGGSIGSETVPPDRPPSRRRACCCSTHSEYALYTIRQELGTRFPGVPVEAHLGSVCNSDLVRRLLQQCPVDTIYHAAAYKHVPLVEANIVEGLRNNVLGAQVIASAAAEHKVDTCVLISSDKAVRPTNIMGASKRIAELIFPGRGSHARRIHHLCHGALRQCPGVVRLRDSPVPAPDRPRRPPDHHAPRGVALFHADPRGGPARHSGGRHGERRGRLRSGHGRAGAHRRSGAQLDCAVGTDRKRRRSRRVAISV